MNFAHQGKLLMVVDRRNYCRIDMHRSLTCGITRGITPGGTICLTGIISPGWACCWQERELQN